MGDLSAAVGARQKRFQGIFQRLSAAYPMVAASTIVDALAQSQRGVMLCGDDPGIWAVVETTARHNLDAMLTAYRERGEEFERVRGSAAGPWAVPGARDTGAGGACRGPLPGLPRPARRDRLSAEQTER